VLHDGQLFALPSLYLILLYRLLKTIEVYCWFRIFKFLSRLDPSVLGAAVLTKSLFFLCRCIWLALGVEVRSRSGDHVTVRSLSYPLSCLHEPRRFWEILRRNMFQRQRQASHPPKSLFQFNHLILIKRLMLLGRIKRISTWIGIFLTISNIITFNSSRKPKP
jgi:hypothetical protein